KKGLKVVARLDEKEYKKIEFTKEDMEKINLKTHTLHPKWNYTITPRNTKL
ncbi:MAG: ISAzo13-like element transposase-related protein, partial [Archaeoglobaceae archaeon]